MGHNVPRKNAQSEGHSMFHTISPLSKRIPSLQPVSFASSPPQRAPRARATTTRTRPTCPSHHDAGRFGLDRALCCLSHRGATCAVHGFFTAPHGRAWLERWVSQKTASYWSVQECNMTVTICIIMYNMHINGLFKKKAVGWWVGL